MIQNVVELVELPDMLLGGFVVARRHPTAPLTIYNYTAKAQYENVWNEATLTCRGLITDDNGNIVARPFRKFFNLEQVERLPDEPFEVTEKLDGSLGVMYWLDTKPYIATRGSFEGEQAQEANRILAGCDTSKLLPSVTYLFEIIYPENRIVVDYHNRRELVLLAAIETDTGKELPYAVLGGLGFGVTPRIAYQTIAELTGRDWPGTMREGFVIRFASGLRVKVKCADYVRLHKLLTGINERTIWRDYLMAGVNLDSLLERVPDEFNAWIKNTVDTMRAQYTAIDTSAQSVYRYIRENVAPNGSRREFADAAKASPYTPILFNMLDGKDYSRHIWRMIEPQSARVFRCDVDA